MNIRKKTFKEIKEKYKLNILIANREKEKAKELFDNYKTEYGNKDYIKERYIYHKTVAESCNWFLNDLEKLEGKK